MGAHQPYMYDSDRRDSTLPEKPFDPKAITRASWEPQPKKPKQKGPFLAFNRHPDAHEVPTGRTSQFRLMSSTTKWWIKFMRYVQLFIRVFQMIAGGGLLTLMIIITNVDPLTAWVMRITPGVVAISCVYAIWHYIRPANSRPPASSAAYQLFAGVMDLAVVPLYAFGVISVNNHGSEWKLLFTSTWQLKDALVQTEYYMLITAAGLHVVSLCISIWLGLMFRRIASMPPDMNPLEDHLTSRVKQRQHKRNKSSVATSYTAISDVSSKRLSTPLEDYCSSGAAYEDLSRPPSIPFMHTRTGSRDSFASSKRDSRSDLPSRQYQITPGNSPRNSVAGSLADLNRLSTSRLPQPQRATYTEVPLHETNASPTSSRPSTATIAAPAHMQPTNASPTRIARFTEAWYASESLINRTQERQRALNAAERRQSRPQSQYEALSQRYNFEDEDSDSDRENRGIIRPDSDDEEEGDNVQSSPINVTAHLHPNPLRLNPIPMSNGGANGSTSDIASRQKTPFRPPPPGRDSAGSALSEVNLNSRRVSGSQDIVDEKPAPGATSFWRRSTIGRSKRGSGSGNAATARNRDSSIQPDGDFYAKPYGELKPATPPIMLDAKKGSAGRQVSSGNDYGDLGSANASAGAWRSRNVSGKVAEEGLAGKRYSRYSILNDD
ncbi:uncharacterized protein F4822DRAFT_409509 [Hypoxylon trugodes]|uniref:uncharacterized protein n=1 Tax=Hypoxylon trugodes TaxID=326681 RepID=UPI00218FCF35|nr:uncharacterized protein F4822DRAFT_409509 [Hypoxylon trugodes]KAI1386273.1 hypothetical protein F4822DRAFT_409509 [Hypoxylon trugodes]